MTTNTTPSTASQAPEVLTKQVAAWRAEVARLNDLIAHATGASQAPAVSIEKDKEFLTLLNRWTKHKDNTNADIMAGHIKWTELIAHIDAKLAQALKDGYDKGANDVQAISEPIINRTVSRATAAEAKLEAIRQGVEGLTRYFPGCFDADDLPKEGQFESPMWGYANGEWLKRDEVLAILQPQPQADESGLPG